MSGFTKFITKHFGGIPTSINDLQWIWRVNPKSPNSLPLASEYRKVAPGSQPLPTKPYEAPISKFRYYDRDDRRNHPQTVVFTPETLKQLPLSAAATTSTPAAASSEPATGGFLSFKYQYKEGESGLDPTGSAENPDFSIRSVQ